MAPKSLQLQIRVSPAEKAALRRLARQAGMDVSAYVLQKALPPARDRVEAVFRSLRKDRDRSYALAGLNDLLNEFTRDELRDALEDPDWRSLSPVTANYVAAMVELAASRKSLDPPPWVREVKPLDEPYFAAGFARIRLYLLRVAPVAFKRRNIFVDATLGDRV